MRFANKTSQEENMKWWRKSRRSRSTSSTTGKMLKKTRKLCRKRKVKKVIYKNHSLWFVRTHMVWHKIWLTIDGWMDGWNECLAWMNEPKVSFVVWCCETFNSDCHRRLPPSFNDDVKTENVINTDDDNVGERMNQRLRHCGINEWSIAGTELKHW